MIKCLIVIEFLLVSFFHQAFAQPELQSFKHLNINEGLSQSSVNCIHQDKTGFIWFGTQDGLNRYDGFEFVIYRNRKGNPNSISNNYITDIYEDDAGVLWIATFGGGLNSLNPLNGKICRYNLIDGDSNSYTSKRLFSITEFPRGTLWIGSNEGLIKFDKSDGKSQLLLAHKATDQEYRYNYIGKVTSDSMGSLWLRSDSGLTRVDVRTHEVKHFRQGPFSGSCDLGEVYDIIFEGALLFVTCDAGLIKIDLPNKTDTLLLSPHDAYIATTPRVFRKILPLSPFKFAIGTNAGLIIYNTKTKQSFLYESNPADPYSLTHNYILSLSRSNDGILWIGTRNGINKLESEDPDIFHFRKIVGRFDLSSNNVNAFIEENDSLLWISTTDGINLLNMNSGSVKAFKKNGIVNTGLSSDYMLCLFKDSKGTKWLGTRNGGFYKIVNRDLSDIRFIPIHPDNMDASSISVHFITEGEEPVVRVY
jgi:ligand-binding sensor domain-containing protein